MTNPIKEKYGSWMDDIESRIRANEGHGPPDDGELVNMARHETGSCLGVIESIESGDGEFLEENLETLKGDILKIRVALEIERGYR